MRHRALTVVAGVAMLMAAGGLARAQTANDAPERSPDAGRGPLGVNAAPARMAFGVFEQPYRPESTDAVTARLRSRMDPEWNLDPTLTRELRNERGFQAVVFASDRAICFGATEADGTGGIGCTKHQYELEQLARGEIGATIALTNDGRFRVYNLLPDGVRDVHATFSDGRSLKLPVHRNFAEALVDEHPVSLNWTTADGVFHTNTLMRVD